MRRRILALATTALAAAAAVGVLVGVQAAPAQAATADQWGFAYVSNPTVPIWTNLDPAHQATSPASPNVQGGKLAPGRFLVKFIGLGFGSRGNVHVTPVARDGHYCEIVQWFASGVDEIVDVQCHKAGGARDDSRFTVLWTVSSGVLPPGNGSYASVQWRTPAIVQAYNSTGGGVSVIPGAPGEYTVTFAGVGVAGALTGNLQVTAVQPNATARRCKVAKWTDVGADISAFIRCYDAAGVKTNTDFTASYHRERSVVASFGPPKYIGYVWSQLPLPASAAQTNFNYPAGGFGFNSVSTSGAVIIAKYPFLNLDFTHVQATAQGDSSNYCALLDLWLTFGPDLQANVLCFDNAGNPKPDNAFITVTNQG